ncbi:MAG: alanine racemase, partial [Blastocatellia bacterium]
MRVTKPYVRDYSYYKRLLSQEAMPCAFLDLDALERNSQHVLRLSGEKLVRIASKSVRSVDVLKRIQARDHRYQGLLCYTAREALFLGRQGFDDLVVAYPTWNPVEIAAVAESTRNHRSITLMIDSVDHIEHIESIARDHEVRIPLCIDIDMASDFPGIHFGVWRSAVRTEVTIRELADRINVSSHVTLDGVMGYEAQIAGLGDRIAGQRLKSSVIRWLKKRSVREVRQRRADLVGAILSSGSELRFVNGGGTGSIASTCGETAVSEVTVGSAFYSPALFDSYRDFCYEPAAGFAIEIVRQPRPDLYTCLGGGYVAS